MAEIQDDAAKAVSKAAPGSDDNYTSTTTTVPSDEENEKDAPSDDEDERTKKEDGVTAADEDPESASKEPLEITNYDVLADEVETLMTNEELDTGLSLAAHSYHVGNNRLEVLCNVHCKGFADHQANGDEESSSSIVEKIRDIVKNQCVPKGRFLQRNGQGEWTEMDEDKERLLIRSTLGQITGIKNSTNNANTSGGPYCSTTNARPQGFQMSRMIMGVSQRRVSKNLEGVAALTQIQKQQEAEAEKKRRRRSSLLRRSVSSSMLPTMRANLLDKKKSTRTGLLLQSSDDEMTLSPDNTPAHSRSNSPFPPSSPSPPPATFGRSATVAVCGRRSISPLCEPEPALLRELVKGPPQKMDVVLNASMTDLIPDADCFGNNRLRVMLSIQSPAYTSATPEVQRKIASDLVGTIHNFWGGRLLAQGGLGVGVDSYVKLNDHEQLQAIKALLNPEDNLDQPVQQGRRASLQAIQSLAPNGGGAASLIMPSTLPSLPAEFQQLRSAAVKSLQKRKQKQSLNNRITRLTADKAAAFQDGQASQVMMRSASPPREATLPPPPYGGAFTSYRQTSCGASVASTVTQMSTGTQGTQQTSYSQVSMRPMVNPHYHNMGGGMQQNNMLPGAIMATMHNNMSSVPEEGGMGITGRAAVMHDHFGGVLNSTGSDGLPRFGDGEMELLSKALEDS